MTGARRNAGRRSRHSGGGNSRTPSGRLGWLVVAVTVPLIVLGVLAGFGIRARKAAAWTQVREEAALFSKVQAQLLSQRLQAAVVELASFPDPPRPGSASPMDEILDGDDLEALARVRDDPEAGLTPPGLPRRALAGLRILELAPDRQDPQTLVELLTDEAPSVLTAVGLRRIQDAYPRIPTPPIWSDRETVRRLAAEHPDGGWIVEGGQAWWIAADGSRFLPPSALQTAALELPAYANARFSSEEQVLTLPFGGELLARAPIEFPAPLTLDWVLSSPELVEEATRQQTRWILALLGASLVSSVIGLAAILRMVARERRLSHLKGQFVASVSHELRAPVGSIRLMAEALEEERAESPAAFHRLIVRESNRLSHLIENVLDFARIEEGRRHYQFEDCDLEALVADTLDLFGHRIEDTSHRLETRLQPCTASVDPMALQQALINLLDNALKFSPKGSKLGVALTCTGAAWTISITSEGRPIPSAEHDRIFERFYRLGEELRRETQGTGIGLSIVRHIIHAHGGDVLVSSNDPETNTFTLRAPLAPPLKP